MEADERVSKLSVQTLALEAFVVSLCRNLANISPELNGAVKAAFADAVDETERLGFLLGDNASGNLMSKGARIIDDMRQAAVGQFA